MRLLFVSNLFPDAVESRRGLYNARLLRHISDQAEVRVLSPRSQLGPAVFKRGLAGKAREEDAALVPVFPSVPYIPKVGSRWNHRLMAWGLRPHVERVAETFNPEIILGSWIYPDGCAVATLARRMGLPWVGIAQGSDIHQYLGMPLRRRIILEALASAGAVVTRSQDLARRLVDSGVEASRIRTLYNGVELDRFTPGDRGQARADLDLPAGGRVVLFVGNFYPVKAPGFLVEVLAELRRECPDVSLIMVGAGPLEVRVRESAAALGIADHVRLVGSQPPERVARYFQAADVLCVPSLNEGVPNVILEAFGSGLPVVAGSVGGIPEILTGPDLGRLVEGRDQSVWAKALLEVLGGGAKREAILEHARQFSWARTADAYLDVLAGVLASPRSGR